MADFLATFMGNAARARVLRAYLLNPAESFTPKTMGKRAGVTTATALKETLVLERWKAVKRAAYTIRLKNSKRTVSAKPKEPAWTANDEFEHAAALSKFVHEVTPVQYQSVIDALKRTGKLSIIVLSGAFMGDPSRPTDLLIVADSLNEARLEAAMRALEPRIGREIRYASFSMPEFSYRMTIQDRLLRDTLDYPHLVLLDKTGLL